MTGEDEARATPDDRRDPAAEAAADAATPAPVPGVEAAAPAELQDRYLRLAAEFDNFRKRTARERAELWRRAQADLLDRLVDALDDLARFAHVDPESTDARTLHEGVELVERKVWKALDALGVRRLDAVNVPFDPNEHEAVSRQPASDPAQDHTVGVVLQAGYRLGDVLIRPARVVVRTWDGPGGAADASAPADG
jgi:molecular chaperone GrpE